MKFKIILLICSILMSSISYTQCFKDFNSVAINPTLSVQTNSDGYTPLRSPFGEDSDWYLVQSFGAKNSDKKNANHPGEDWNHANDDHMPVYPIAAGTVVKNELVYSRDAKYGYFVILEHTGIFNIPQSTGPHLNSAVDLAFLDGYGSYKESAGFIDAKDVFTSSLNFNNQLYHEDAYQYTGTTIAVKLYSVYMHLNKNDQLQEGTQITDINQPIGTLAPSKDDHKAHLHFEIRYLGIAGDADSNIGNFLSVMGQSKTRYQGYFYSNQTMVDLGYREPSSIIQANSCIELR